MMVTRECTSGYSAWVQMKKEDEHVMAYKNIGRRVLILHKHGYLEEIKLENVENLHGRKDYKVTMKGMEKLIPYIMTHPEDVTNINEYVMKFGLDKRRLLELLIDKYHSGLDTLYVILVTTLVPKIDDSIWTYEVAESMNQLLRNIKKLKEAFPKSSSKPIFRKEGKEPVDLRSPVTASAYEVNKTVEDKKESTSSSHETVKTSSGRKKKPA
jgi:hypothetical protein